MYYRNTCIFGQTERRVHIQHKECDSCGELSQSDTALFRRLNRSTLRLGQMLMGRNDSRFSFHGTEDFHDVCIMILSEDIPCACALHSIFDTCIEAKDLSLDILVARDLTARGGTLHLGLQEYLNSCLGAIELKSAILCLLVS